MNHRRFDPRSPRRRALPACAVALLACASLAARAAAPEETLLEGVTGDFREPRLACEWVAGQFDSIAGQLSLYREELVAFEQLVGGIAIGDSASGAVQGVEFESRLVGPIR